MIHFLSNIHKWALTLLTVESSSVVFPIYFMQSASLFALCQDGGKKTKGYSVRTLEDLEDYSDSDHSFHDAEN